MSGLGLCFLILWAWYTISTDYFILQSPYLSAGSVVMIKAIEYLVMVSMSGALIYAGYWFNSRKFSHDQVLWATIWTVLGSIGIVSVVLVVNAHQLIDGLVVPPEVLVEEILLGAAGGGIAGLLIGIETSRSMAQANRLSTQRNAFAFLNSLLRHNLRNALTIIHGKATRLAADAPEEYRADIQAIQDRSESITALATRIRTFAEVLSGDATLERIDLADVVRKEVTAAKSSFTDATFDASIPEEVYMQGHPALSGVFDNLLSNAVEHHDRANPHVTITVRESPDAVDVEIADDGPGVADEDTERIFDLDESDDHGLGLFLVDTIVTYFGGEVRVTDNEPRGAVFTVTLPKPASDGDVSRQTTPTLARR